MTEGTDTRKKVKMIILIPLFIFAVIWIASLAKCVGLTCVYKGQFKDNYYEHTMIGDIDYLRVLDYSDNESRVYYVSKGRAAGSTVTFLKTDGEWEVSKWDTVWSSTGSASEVIWPYWWHFIFGGF